MPLMLGLTVALWCAVTRLTAVPVLAAVSRLTAVSLGRLLPLGWPSVTAPKPLAETHNANTFWAVIELIEYHAPAGDDSQATA